MGFRTYKPKQKEAFCLMKYECKDCKHQELIWNSRDGVTYFEVPCTKCDQGMMQHIDWEEDKFLPSYIAPKGSRIFIDLTKEKFEDNLLHRIEATWEHPVTPAKDHFESKEDMFNKLNEFEEGQPDIITVPDPVEQKKFRKMLMKLVESIDAIDVMNSMKESIFKECLENRKVKDWIQQGAGTEKDLRKLFDEEWIKQMEACDQYCKCGHKLCEHSEPPDDPDGLRSCLWCDCIDYHFDHEKHKKVNKDGH
jgi:hypothetical protein